MSSIFHGEPPPPGTDLEYLLSAPPPPPPPEDASKRVANGVQGSVVSSDNMPTDMEVDDIGSSSGQILTNQPYFEGDTTAERVEGVYHFHVHVFCI